MLRMCSLLGQPQDKYPCIHVAGTNGKGSTCNMLCASLAGDGMSVGLYTSPHILDFRERMRIVKSDEIRMISKREVWDFLEKYEAVFDEFQLSFFEITTVMAFDFFAANNVDIAVIETGLGGRLDATNIIRPILSIITNIGLDHMDLLGDTLEKIAVEKAGIIKDGIPVVVGESCAETRPVFEAVASEHNTNVIYAEKQGYGSGYIKLLNKLDLKGDYQKNNLRTVLCALEAIGKKPNLESIARTSSICQFHGRWESLCESPKIIGDIGHNEHGLKYNFAQLEKMLLCDEISDLVMVYGSVSDKDVDAVLRILPKRAYVFFTAAASKRAMSAQELFARARHPYGEVCSNVGDALAKALERSEKLSKPLIYIGGSTYVLSEAVFYLDKRNI